MATPKQLDLLSMTVSRGGKRQSRSQQDTRSATRLKEALVAATPARMCDRRSPADILQYWEEELARHPTSVELHRQRVQQHVPRPPLRRSALFEALMGNFDPTLESDTDETAGPQKNTESESTLGPQDKAEIASPAQGEQRRKTGKEHPPAKQRGQPRPRESTWSLTELPEDEDEAFEEAASSLLRGFAAEVQAAVAAQDLRMTRRYKHRSTPYV